MLQDLWATRRKAILIAVAVAVILIVSGVTLILRGRPAQEATAQTAQTTDSEQLSTSAVGVTLEDPTSSATAAPGEELTAATGYDHAGWDAVPAVTARTAAGFPPIEAVLRTQPDTFVKAFGTEMLTRNYLTESRTDLLSWAQSEAAALTITQVPLTTADRNKALIVSLTSADWDGSTTVVPAEDDWAELGSLHAWTSVSDAKVETVPDFPPANVSFTDPLALARLFTATVTLHTTYGSSQVTSRTSVAFQVVLGTSLLHGQVFGAASTEGYIQRVLS